MPITQDKNAPRVILVTLAVIMFVTVMVIVVLKTAMPKGFKIRTYDEGYAEGFKKARASIANGPCGGMMGRAQNITLSGTVTNVGSSSLAFSAIGLIVDPSVDGVSSDRTVNVGPTTKIKFHLLKPDAVLAAEMRTYQDAVRNNPKSNPQPPAPYKEVSGKLSDIKPNDHVTVWGDQNQDLTTVDPINASKIVIVK
jgi:hypothetical protein